MKKTEAEKAAWRAAHKAEQEGRTKKAKRQEVIAAITAATCPDATPASYRMRPRGASKDEVIEFYTAVMRSDEVDLKDRLSAAEKLSRLCGWEKAPAVEAAENSAEAFFTALLRRTGAAAPAWQRGAIECDTE